MTTPAATRAKESGRNDLVARTEAGYAPPSTSREGPHHAIRRRPQEGRRHSDERRKDPPAGGAAVRDLADDRDRGLLCDLDRGREAQDRRGRQADRPQGRPHLQGDAALLADRRARLRAFARRHDDRRRRQGGACELLPAARRDRARLRARQTAGGPGRRPARRAARHRICGSGDRDRRRAPAGPAQDFRHGGGQRRGRRHRDRRGGGRGGRRARPSRPGRGLARQQARPARRRARARPSGAGGLVHPGGVRRQGRHAACRFRAARRHRGAIRLNGAGPMEHPRNAFKHAIAKGELQVGLWCSLCSPITAEIVSHSGFDWLLLDTEHSPNEVPDVLAQLQAVQAGTASAIVRPAWNVTVLIKRFLDIGAQSLLIPFVQNPDEARRAVEATRYPPGGVRGITGSGRASRYGRVKDYLKNASREICLLVQVETRSALENIEAIASVDCIDGVFIGPNDLAASFGHIGNWGHPEVQAALEDAARRLQKIGKPAGILTPNEEEAKRFIQWGYTFVAVGADLGSLARGADALAKRFKG